MRRGLVVLCQFLWEQQGLKERHQRGSLHPAAGAPMALPFLRRCSFGLSSPGQEARAGQSCGRAPGAARLHLPRARCLPAGLLLPPHKRDLGNILLCLHPSWAGSRSRSEKPGQLCSETGARGPVKVTRCRGFTAAAAPEGNLPAGKSPAPPLPPQMAKPEIPPSAAAQEMPIGQICCCQQKTKPLPSPAAGDKRDGRRSSPAEAPREQWKPFREAKLDKGSRCPQTPAAASAQNGGCKFGFFHVNPLRRC